MFSPIIPSQDQAIGITKPIEVRFQMVDQKYHPYLMPTHCFRVRSFSSELSRCNVSVPIANHIPQTDKICYGRQRFSQTSLVIDLSCLSHPIDELDYSSFHAPLNGCAWLADIVQYYSDQLIPTNNIFAWFTKASIGVGLFIFYWWCHSFKAKCHGLGNTPHKYSLTKKINQTTEN